MTTKLTIRQSGGSAIVSLPMSVLKTLNLHAGSVMILSLENHKIVLTPASDETTLENLLINCKAKNFALTDEDLEWVTAKTRGKEI